MINVTIEPSRDRLQVAVMVALVILFQTCFAEYSNYVAGTIPLKPSHWAYLAYIIAILFAAFRTDILVRAIKNPVFWWALAYLAVSMLWTLWTKEDEPVLRIFRERLQTAAFLIAGLIFLQSRRATHVARWAIVWATLFNVALNVWDAIHPLWFSTTLGRSAGLFLNPNRSAMALIFGLVISIGVLPQRWRGLFYLAVSLGAILTFSRAALLCVPLVGVGLLLQHELKGRTIITTLVGAIAVVSLYFWATGVPVGILSHSKIWNQDTTARAHMDVNDVSTKVRMQVARAALDMFARSPIVGYGVGASQLWQYEESSHNIYLNMMVDHGLFGAALVFSLLYLLWRRNREAALFVFVCFYWGFYSHNLLEERALLIPIVIQAVMTQRVVEAAELRERWVQFLQWTGRQPVHRSV